MSSFSAPYIRIGIESPKKGDAGLELQKGGKQFSEDEIKIPPASELIAKERRIEFLNNPFPQITFLETWDQVVVFVSYIGIFLCYSSWVHLNQGISYSATMLVMSVLVTKLVASIIAYRIVDGSLQELYSELLRNRKSLVLFIFPAFAYSTADSLGVFCYKRLDPATVCIVYQVRVVFLLLLFQYFMRVSLRMSHWVAMAMVVVSCILKELPNVLYPEVTADMHDAALGPSRLLVVLIVVLMAQLSAFAAVYNEKLLKEQQLSLNVQNVAMYSWSIIATFIFSITIPLLQKNGTVIDDIGNFEMWKTIWTYPIVGAVLLSALYGLATSYFIKSLNNVVRELACALQIIVALFSNSILFGYGVRLTDILATVGVISGVTVYNNSGGIK